ncbi:MAG: hypothetical protein JJU19_00580 [Pararhodobacter sp.]|nr:hypothetical protein [Pararhodobacter sp.]
MQAFRSLALILLALAVMAASVPMAMARHHGGAVGTVELCTGTGMITLRLDAEGNPAGPEVPCPDCMPALSAALPDAVAGPVLPLRLVGCVPALRDRDAPCAALSFHRHARAPPVPV